tara:strand:+ start:322 stop:636 length:315 start_codon:yes stop_codon:yes gene_type:complete
MNKSSKDKKDDGVEIASSTQSYKKILTDLKDTRIELDNLKTLEREHRRINGTLRLKLAEADKKSKFAFTIPVEPGHKTSDEVVGAISDALKKYVKKKKDGNVKT